MASSSPCDYWPHLSHSLSSPSSSSLSPSSSSLSQTLLPPPPPPPSGEHVWNDLKLSSLSNSSVDCNHSSSHSSLLSLSLSPSHNHHSLLSLSNASFHSNHTARHQDQHRNRIMKNRQSAVRSRARKQAYRKGLEDEIARLTEENSRLRRELKEFSLSSSENSPQRTSATCRTTSSPF